MKEQHLLLGRGDSPRVTDVFRIVASLHSAVDALGRLLASDALLNGDGGAGFGLPPEPDDDGGRRRRANGNGLNAHGQPYQAEMSAKRLAKLRLQGRYVGVLKRLNDRDGKKVRALYKSKGARAAIAEGKRLAKSASKSAKDKDAAA